MPGGKREKPRMPFPPDACRAVRLLLAEDALDDLFRRFLPRGDRLYLDRWWGEGPDEVASDIREDALHDPVQVPVNAIDDAASIGQAAGEESTPSRAGSKGAAHCSRA